jgi:hypothetical protein
MGQGLFAETAIVKLCKQGEASCQQGSFDDLYGPFEDAVKLVYVEHFVLMEGSTSLDYIRRNALRMSGYLGWALEL